MQLQSDPPSDAERAQPDVLKSCRLDGPEAAFDPVVRFPADLFEVPAAPVSASGASLGLDVIAKGIDLPEQASAPAGFGCREARGCLAAKPTPSKDFVARRAAPMSREAA